MELTSSTFVRIEGTRISVTAGSMAEAKLALKELKLKRKEFGIQKRIIASRQKEVRAQYTGDVRARGSMMRGGGGFGTFVRSMQTFSRDGKRSQLATDLAPLDKAKQEVESMIHAIDSVILQLEAKLLKDGA